MRETWTDKRLDDFRSEVGHRFDLADLRFDAVDQRSAVVDEKFAAVDKRFDRVEDQIDGLRTETRTEFTALRGEMKEGFEAVATSSKQMEQQMSIRFEAMHRLLVQSAIGLVAAFAAVVAGLLGFIATQL